jgi:hypothetical protein
MENRRIHRGPERHFRAYPLLSIERVAE